MTGPCGLAGTSEKGLVMRLHQFAMLALGGWFLMVAPVPSALGKFDAGAPMTKWNAKSPMFRTREQCESFRKRAASDGVEKGAGVNQFVTDDSMVLVVPQWASRCIDAGSMSVDTNG